MRMDLGTRNTLLYDSMHCMTAVSLEMSDEPYNVSGAKFNGELKNLPKGIYIINGKKVVKL